MSLGIALGPQDRSRREAGLRERALAVPAGTDPILSSLVPAEQGHLARANMGFGPVVLASLAMWGVIGFTINWALHV